MAVNLLNLCLSKNNPGDQIKIKNCIFISSIFIPILLNTLNR
jgi:hypothetical protein